MPSSAGSGTRSIRASRSPSRRRGSAGPAGSVDDAVRAQYERWGYGPGYRLPGLSHRTGHGIGLDGHEPVNLVHGETTPLAAGMCFSNEPGIYLPGKFGIRLEDCFHMTASRPALVLDAAALARRSVRLRRSKMVYEARQSPRLNYLLAGALPGAVDPRLRRRRRDPDAERQALSAGRLGDRRRLLRRRLRLRAPGDGRHGRGADRRARRLCRAPASARSRARCRRDEINGFDQDPRRRHPADPRASAGAGPSARTFGINTTFYDRGIDDLVATVRHYRPDLHRRQRPALTFA